MTLNFSLLFHYIYSVLRNGLQLRLQVNLDETPTMSKLSRIMFSPLFIPFL